MRLRDEIKLATVPIYFVLGAFVIGGTALLARMAPALDEVLSENVASVEASVEMLAALAQDDVSTHETEREFREAFERARTNVTVDGESELIQRIESNMDLAFAGDASAKVATIEALVELERLNVASMREASDGARKLGSAGTAAMLMFATIAIVVGIRGRRRVYRSIVNAVMELNATMRQAMEANDSMRRVSATQCATELAIVADGVNRLLDERARRRDDEVGLSTVEKAALNRLLDRQPQPTMLVSRGGELLAASAEVLGSVHPERLASVVESVRAAREARVSMPSFPDWISSEAIGEVGWLLAFRDGVALQPETPGGRSAVEVDEGNAAALSTSGSPSSGVSHDANDVPVRTNPPPSMPHTIGHGPSDDDDGHDEHDEHTGVVVRPGQSLFRR